jgi:hypothetical protein
MALATNQVNELLYQALETEMGGAKLYEAAVDCAVNADLKKEWSEYLEQTREHERILLEVFEALQLDPQADSPGRRVVRHLGESLGMAIAMARKSGGPPEAAELVAAECISLAETKDHMNWELIGEVAKSMQGAAGKALAGAYQQVEKQEDEHLYHTKGWTRELWIASLGMPAVLPPPEEVKHVETAIGAARAQQSRDQMAKKHTARRS